MASVRVPGPNASRGAEEAPIRTLGWKWDLIPHTNFTLSPRRLRDVGIVVLSATYVFC